MMPDDGTEVYVMLGLLFAVVSFFGMYYLHHWAQPERLNTIQKEKHD